MLIKSVLPAIITILEIAATSPAVEVRLPPRITTVYSWIFPAPDGFVSRFTGPRLAKPECPNVPLDYWSCLSECLYKKSCNITNDKACVSDCDYGCGRDFVAGFPDCDPGGW